MERKMFDTPVLPRLATILAEVKSGDLVVPRFQRPFVWDDDRRLQLLDSIAQGMPIGSLLVWRTSRRDLETYERVGGIRLERARQGDEKVNYLLDGHQRISTLFGALQSGEREPPGKDDDTRWPLFYELGAKERPAFRIAPRRGDPPVHWLPLDILLDGDALFDFTQRLRLESKRDLAREAENLANIFRDYIIPIVPLVTEELDTVTDAFVRINSQGKGMTEAHMLRALTHLKTIDTDQHFSEVRARLQAVGWGRLDDQVLVNVLKAMLGLDVYASGVRRVHEMLKTDSKPLGALASAVEEAVEALNAIGVCGPPALPYAYQLVTLAAIAARFPGRLGEPGVRDNLRRWFWITTYTEHFTGMTGSGIRDTIEDLASKLWGPPIKADLVETVELLPAFRLPSVRARAFLLFLAQLPENETARSQHQQLLGMDDVRSAPLLYPDWSRSDPANRVIAAPAELRKLRAALQRGQILTSDLADAHGIPEEAVRVLPDPKAFLDARRNWLFRHEKAFVESFVKDAPSPRR
ncbi:DUF262 domain-containing protein [Sorangium sp. So ce426]|uniref:DUF262 domain-containing protein n=1 Tax=Sorangium sp. So ce426 TaxID=3133312 RepID=UPI003F5B65EF